jgi:hypothetical protein
LKVASHQPIPVVSATGCYLDELEERELAREPVDRRAFDPANRLHAASASDPLKRVPQRRVERLVDESHRHGRPRYIREVVDGEFGAVAILGTLVEPLMHEVAEGLHFTLLIVV